MPDYSNLPTRDGDGHFHVIVEAPRGSLAKLKFDPEKSAFVFQKALDLGVTYPFDWGFVPSTRAEDGDPLDAMVLFEGGTWPGVIVPSLAIGVVRLMQREKGKKAIRNDRIIAVAAASPTYAHIDELPKRVRKELEQFFVTMVELSSKEVEIEGWQGPKHAEKLVDAAAKTYSRGKKK